MISRSLELVEDVERLVLEHLPKRLGDTALAKAVGVNVGELHRAFLDARNSTMYQALYRLRLETVKRILESDPSRSPEAVAFQCGFGHYGVFHRRYRTYLASRAQEGRDLHSDESAGSSPAQAGA